MWICISRHPAVAIAVLLFMFGPSLANADSKPDLSGTWELNAAMSEDPKEKLRQAGKSAGRTGGGRGRGFGGGGRRAGGSKGGSRDGGLRDSGASQGMNGLMSNSTLMAKTLEIQQEALQVTLSYGDQVMTFNTDGQGTMLADGASVALAGWEEAQFVIEKTVNGGPKIFERYTLSPDGKQLHVGVTIKSERLPKPVVVYRIYDAVATTDMK